MATKQNTVMPPNTGLWGFSRSKQKRKKQSSTKGDNKGRPASLRTYCPICPEIAAKPETKSHVTCNKKTKLARGKCKHKWFVGGESYAGPKQEIEQDLS